MFNAGNHGNNPTDLGKPYYQIREEDPQNQYVEVYMSQTDKAGGQQLHEGGIYTIQKWQADSVISNGSGVMAEAGPLKLTKTKMDIITQTLKEETEKVKANDHLSDIGKREQIKALVAQSEALAEATQAQYANELEVLLQAETKRAAQSTGSSKMDPHEARTQAGLIKAEVAVAPTLEKALDAIRTKLPHLDSAVSRELLAQYADIKRDLAGLSKGVDGFAKVKEGQLIRALYTDLVTATTTPEQAQAMAKKKMLEAMQNYRGDIRTEYKTLTRGLTRYVQGYSTGIR